MGITFYRTSEPSAPEEEVEIPPSDPLDIDCKVPNLMEIKEAIKGLKNNKAAGPDHIPAEVIKADIDTSAKAFLVQSLRYGMISFILRTGRMDNDISQQ